MKTETEIKKYAAARRAAVFARANGRCEVMTSGCLGEASELQLDAGWRAVGADDSPLHALRAVCRVCLDRWAR